jgi:hypothetical protein
MAMAPAGSLPPQVTNCSPPHPSQARPGQPCHRAAAAGAQLRVVVGSPPMRRILELTAADQVLNTYPTLAAALAEGQIPDRS